VLPTTKKKPPSKESESATHYSKGSVHLDFILTLSPTSNLAKPEKVSHPFLMFFHNPTPKAPTSSREHHPPHKLPNLESTTTLHQASLSIPNRHNHLLDKAQLNINKFLIPSPPSEIGVQTFDQLTK
jgi:hypothetical protein